MWYNGGIFRIFITIYKENYYATEEKKYNKNFFKA